MKYTHGNGTEHEVPAGQYEIDAYGGLLRPIQSAYWPSIGYGFNPVRIRYQAGYRPTGSPIDLTDNTYLPAALRTWMAARIVTLYDQRSQLVIGTIVQEVPRDFVDGLLDSLTLGSRLF